MATGATGVPSQSARGDLPLLDDSLERGLGLDRLDLLDRLGCSRVLNLLRKGFLLGMGQRFDAELVTEPPGDIFGDLDETLHRSQTRRSCLSHRTHDTEARRRRRTWLR